MEIDTYTAEQAIIILFILLIITGIILIVTRDWLIFWMAFIDFVFTYIILTIIQFTKKEDLWEKD